MTQHFSRRRRTILVGTAVAGAGFMLGISFLKAGRPMSPETTGRTEDLFRPNAWLRIRRDGVVTVMLAKAEMGQGVSTSIPMLVAEELEVDWQSVRVEQAPSTPEFGNQVTGGSSSVRGSWVPLREAGAAAREMLVAAAAQEWKVDVSGCRAESGTVVHKPSGRRLSYGELAETAARQSVPSHLTLKPSKDFRIIGTAVAPLDIADKTSGRAIYGIDVQVPAALTAVVVRAPVFGATVTGFNAARALSGEGVRHVVQIDRGVAVVADDYWSARRGAAQLDVQWDTRTNGNANSKDIRKLLVELAKKRDGVSAESRGDARKALLEGSKTVEAEYETPFQAHATMEPMNCTAHVRSDLCEVWAPTQAPNIAQEVAAKYTVSAPVALWDKLRKRLGLRPVERIRVHTTQLGCGFGRRLEQDYVAEAVQISSAVRRPVKVVWSREDDMRHGYYRPATFNRLAATLDITGRLVGWSHTIVGPSINEYLWPGSVRDGVDWSLVEGATKLPYSIPNLNVEYVMAKTPVPLGLWRSVGHSHNAYVTECFLDEIAGAAGRDPLAFRLDLLVDAPRPRKVLEFAAKKAGWGRTLKRGHYRGVALHYAFRSYVAQIAEISIDNRSGKVRVHRVVCAIDCGQAVNPDTVAAQMEGGIVFGLSAALKGEITIREGRVEQSNFDNYDVLRLSEMPAIETYIVPSSEQPGGVGEAGVPPIAAAVANAIFAATGKRIRRLPVRPEDIRRF